MGGYHIQDLEGSVIVAMVDPSSKAAAAADPLKSGASCSNSAYMRIYRQRLLPGNNFSPPIYVDGMEIFKLGNARRASVRVSPGAHTITSDDKSSMIQIDAKGGQEFSVSVQELPGGFLKGRGKLTLVANEMIEQDNDASSPAAA